MPGSLDCRGRQGRRRILLRRHGETSEQYAARIAARMQSMFQMMDQTTTVRRVCTRGVYHAVAADPYAVLGHAFADEDMEGPGLLTWCDAT